ncbi:MAG TPA: response regulator [Gaiellaceae bacterium]|jgi:two-component system response regulator AlgR
MRRNTRIRVVLADGDVDCLEALASAMEADGRFEVVGLAANGAEAFQMACWHEPHVTVMDVAMPGIGGLEAARLLRQSRPRACVLMVSAAEACAEGLVSKTDLAAVLEAAARGVAGHSVYT